MKEKWRNMKICESNNLINPWNSLPDYIKESKTLNISRAVTMIMWKMSSIYSEKYQV